MAYSASIRFSVPLFPRPASLRHTSRIVPEGSGFANRVRGGDVIRRRPVWLSGDSRSGGCGRLRRWQSRFRSRAWQTRRQPGQAV